MKIIFNWSQKTDSDSDSVSSTEFIISSERFESIFSFVYDFTYDFDELTKDIEKSAQFLIIQTSSESSTKCNHF